MRKIIEAHRFFISESPIYIAWDDIRISYDNWMKVTKKEWCIAYIKFMYMSVFSK